MKEELLKNIDQLHTTIMGENRIKKNLCLEEEIDVLEYCKEIIFNPNSNVFRKGKNWYVELNLVVLTINAFSYTIITAHKSKTR